MALVHLQDAILWSSVSWPLCSTPFESFLILHEAERLLDRAKREMWQEGSQSPLGSDHASGHGVKGARHGNRRTLLLDF